MINTQILESERPTPKLQSSIFLFSRAHAHRYYTHSAAARIKLERIEWLWNASFFLELRNRLLIFYAPRCSRFCETFSWRCVRPIWMRWARRRVEVEKPERKRYEIWARKKGVKLASDLRNRWRFWRKNTVHSIYGKWNIIVMQSTGKNLSRARQ